MSFLQKELEWRENRLVEQRQLIARVADLQQELETCNALLQEYDVDALEAEIAEIKELIQATQTTKAVVEEAPAVSEITEVLDTIEPISNTEAPLLT